MNAPAIRLGSNFVMLVQRIIVASDFQNTSIVALTSHVTLHFRWLEAFSCLLLDSGTLTLEYVYYSSS